MKTHSLLIIVAILASGCAKQLIQVFDSAAPKLVKQDSSWVYENDTVKIIYDFWTEKGKLDFTIYNKLSKPIYVDWKNSSFIYNGTKLDFWVDEQKIAQIGSSSIYKGIVFQESATRAMKPEKTTFIPPNSSYSPEPKYHLQLGPVIVSHAQENQKVVKVVDMAEHLNPSKVQTRSITYSQSFNSSNSPLNFRCYLAFSFSETGSDFFFIDNAFYISSVIEMEPVVFKGDPIGAKGYDNIYGKSPFERATSFYLQVKQ